jgi:general secretion pathway protein H
VEAAAVTGVKPPRERGFTLIELLLVLVIIAIGTSLSLLALRDPAQAQLQGDATRLAGLLEGARAASRAQDTPLLWRVEAAGFRFEGSVPFPSGGPWPDRWLHGDTQAQVLGGSELVLGPEPVLAAQAVLMGHKLAPERRVWVATDGVRPFEVLPIRPELQR